MKTALQELIEFMELNYGHICHDDVIVKANELIGKEKGQIINAFGIGRSEQRKHEIRYKGLTMCNISTMNAEEYYEKTFKY